MIKRLLVAVLFFFSSSSMASHIVGGEFNLLYLSPNKYQMNLILYFDALNGFEQLLDQEVYAHIYRWEDDSLMLVKFLPRLLLEDVPYYQENCEFDGIKTTRIIYGDTITLADSLFNDPSGYYAAWENCCRNYDVTNAVTGNPPAPNTPPGPQSGQTYFLSFPPIVKEGKPYINSSPSLFRAFNSYACVGVPYWADFGGVDNDGDTLLYSLALPMDVAAGYQLNTTRPAPYPSILWEEGFSPANMMAGDPKLFISSDGILTVTPKMQGLFVFAVQCREIRNGKVIGWAIREFQLYVTDWCEPDYPPLIQAKLINDLSYTHENEMSISFNTNLPEEERCIKIRVTDEDAAIEEVLSFRVIALNFEGDVGIDLPDSVTTVLHNGDGFDFDICFPECPLIDPSINEYYEIGLIALDDACPLPRMDTLILKVKIEPPANQEPYLLAGGQDLDVFTQMVTETSGGNYSLPIQGIDADGQMLNLTIVPLGNFDPSKAGIIFTTPQYTSGMVNTQLNWDFDCANALDFSEGIDVYVDEYTTRKAYDFYIILEDIDQCLFSRADTLEINLLIDFPGEAHPNIFKDGNDETIEYYQEVYELNETIKFNVRALDGAGDNDNLNIVAIGQNFDLITYGAMFSSEPAGPGVPPGSPGLFTWPLKCDLFELGVNDIYSVLFVVTDIDDCNLVNSDTLTVDFKLLESINDAPELSFQNIPGAVPIVNNTLAVDYLNTVDIQLFAQDINSDSVTIALASITGQYDIQEYSFNTVGGIGSTSASFVMGLGCEYLDGLNNTDYKLKFIASDWSCGESLADTLELTLTISSGLEKQQKFIPPNVFTPNSDGINDFFAMVVPDPMNGKLVNILPPDDCAGEFRDVSIVNRWGTTVFSSDNRDFKWYGDRAPAGVYYYAIRYSNKEYNGSVSVIY